MIFDNTIGNVMSNRIRPNDTDADANAAPVEPTPKTSDRIPDAPKTTDRTTTAPRTADRAPVTPKTTDKAPTNPKTTSRISERTRPSPAEPSRAPRQNIRDRVTTRALPPSGHTTPRSAAANVAGETSSKFSKEELDQAIQSLESTKSKCEKALTRLPSGTPQHTLTKRRIRAFDISLELLRDQALIAMINEP